MQNLFSYSDFFFLLQFFILNRNYCKKMNSWRSLRKTSPAGFWFVTHLRQQEEGLLVVSGDDFSQRAIHTNVSNCNREQTVMDFACTMMDLYPCVFFFCVCVRAGPYLMRLVQECVWWWMLSLTTLTVMVGKDLDPYPAEKTSIADHQHPLHGGAWRSTQPPQLYDPS